MKQTIATVAVPVPLRRTFDFKIPPDQALRGPQPCVGARVQVPFGARELIGVIIQLKDHSEYPEHKLKSLIKTLDPEPVFDPLLWSVLQWISRYYIAPIGEVLDTALPQVLRKGNPLAPPVVRSWRLTEHGRSCPIEELERAPLQLAIVKRFMHREVLSPIDFKQGSSGWRQALASLVNKGWIEEQSSVPELKEVADSDPSQVSLNEQQRIVVQKLQPLLRADRFSTSLLHGVTGSGKTEVYFAAMRQVIKHGRQVLMLVPEIGLTPQLLQRVKTQLGCPMVTMHSGLNPGERHLAWWHARQGSAKVVIGTRSAVFAPLQNLGLIVIDEEHDGSFKQQDGVRYQARDVAIYRAKQHDIPIVLGSATPSLESYANARSGRYQYLTLTARATSTDMPEVELLDLNRLPSIDGLSPTMTEAIEATLNDGKQVMLFLNRRGYAPVLYCADCGTTVKCHRCDSHLTLHRSIARMRCHHCGFEGNTNKQCASCNSERLVEVGEGTQRVEEALAQRFPAARLLRIDRDSTRRKGELARLLEQASAGDADILLGTQLLTKGHDFPAVALVGILNADQGLYSTDFRASEVLFQQLVQVSGRAGRRDQVGRVLIQTSFPDDPFFSWVIKHDFNGFAQHLLKQRQACNYPPFGYFALMRADSTHQSRALQFLRHARAAMPCRDDVQIMDPIPAPMERRAGRHRAQLLFSASNRSALHATLVSGLEQLANDALATKLAGSVRWNLDIDPIDHY
ncbi:MAG: primosomal protein N' [Arenicella sp.]|nr:primosomal protein N' [Arenicella sp.]